MAVDTELEDRIELPEDFAAHLARVSNLDRTPETLAAYWEQFAEELVASERRIQPADMYTADPTRHEVHVDGQIHYAPCVLDALTAAELEAHNPVTVRSVDPRRRRPVEFTVDEESMAVTPAAAVISFGIASTIPALESSTESIFSWMLRADRPSVDTAFCNYINAFESADVYEEWDANVRGETIPVEPRAARMLIKQYVDIE